MSSSEEESDQEVEDEEFNQAFGEHTGIDEEVRGYINDIKDNTFGINELVLRSDGTDDFTDLAWRLLGRYIANNTLLKRIDLDKSGLTDEKIILLFRELTSSRSIERLDIDHNEFGIEGVRSMLPLLQNSPQFTSICMGANSNIDAECLKLLVSSLDGKSVTKLFFYNCNITDISALYNVPNLQILNLDRNNIGREGCIILSNRLQQENSTLEELYLTNTGMGDEEAEVLANSLKHNTKLTTLDLQKNNITKRGYKAFSKLLVDISSIESTYKSNHTLITFELDEYDSDNTRAKALKDARFENLISSNPEAAGRGKVIKFHLNSQIRKKLCELQDIEYIPGSIFADIEPVFLPKILSLIGQKNGQSELYTSLIHTAPDLLSYIDRKAMLDEAMAKNTAQATALSHECAQKVAEYEQKIAALKTELLAETSRLTAENNELNNRRTLIDLGDSRQSTTGEGEGRGGISRGKKRGRS